MQLIGRRDSPDVRRVAVSLHWMGLAFVSILLDGARWPALDAHGRACESLDCFRAAPHD